MFVDNASLRLEEHTGLLEKGYLAYSNTNSHCLSYFKLNQMFCELIPFKGHNEVMANEKVDTVCQKESFSLWLANGLPYIETQEVLPLCPKHLKFIAISNRLHILLVERGCSPSPDITMKAHFHMKQLLKDLFKWLLEYTLSLRVWFKDLYKACNCGLINHWQMLIVWLF